MQAKTNRKKTLESKSKAKKPKPRARPKTAKEKTVVMLGNVGFGDASQIEETIALAERLPKASFVGIDLKKLGPRLRKPKNIRQWQHDFIGGLSRLEDNSLSHVISIMSLGHYNSKGEDIEGYRQSRKLAQETKENTHEALKLIYRKLAKGGNLRITLGQSVLLTLMKSFEGTGFNKKNIKYWRINNKPNKSTFWMKAYIGPIYRVRAEK